MYSRRCCNRVSRGSQCSRVLAAAGMGGVVDIVLVNTLLSGVDRDFCCVHVNFISGGHRGTINITKPLFVCCLRVPAPKCYLILIYIINFI